MSNPTQRWTTKDLKDEDICDLIWTSWQELMHIVNFLEKEGYITQDTTDHMFQLLLDVKTPVMAYCFSEEKSDE